MIERVQIEWGNMGRSVALEEYILEKSKKILRQASEATALIYSLAIENPINSSGVPEQRIDAILRLPHHPDIHAEKRGSDLYKTVLDVQHAILSQLKRKKSHKLAKRHEVRPNETDKSA